MQKQNTAIRTLLIVLLSMGSGCSKNSSSTPVVTPPPCTTDFCLLTGYKWEITSQTIATDIGLFTYTTSQAKKISWANFTFKKDSSYKTDAGDQGTFSYTVSSKKMVLYDNLLPLDFTVAFPTNSSLVLSGDTVRMHPRTDPSTTATFSINSIAGSLYNDFGVDTSKIHYFQAKFYYDGF
ncbi:MAG TPA: hypothetical protein VE035_10790 [Puia sp.]|nr:hypothetical protein [Puia sp.]